MTTPRRKLWLYQDPQGRVWYRDEYFSPQPTELSLTRLLSHYIDDLEDLYAYSTADQADLVLKLYDWCNGNSVQLNLGGPQPKDGTPVSKLYSLNRLARKPPSLGGFRQAMIHDVRQLKFLSVCRQSEQWTESLRQATAAHPAFPAMSFFQFGDSFAQAKLLEAIEDPRWFTDPQHPDRESRLKMFLGVTSANAQRLAEFKPPTGYNHKRLTLLIRSIWGTDSLSPVPICKAALFPNYMRQNAKDKVRGVLRGLELAVSFIRQVWLHETAPVNRTLFVPRYFFECLPVTGVDEAYVNHRKNMPWAKAGG